MHAVGPTIGVSRWTVFGPFFGVFLAETELKPLDENRQKSPQNRQKNRNVNPNDDEGQVEKNVEVPKGMVEDARAVEIELARAAHPSLV